MQWNKKQIADYLVKRIRGIQIGDDLIGETAELSGRNPATVERILDGLISRIAGQTRGERTAKLTICQSCGGLRPAVAALLGEPDTWLADRNCPACWGRGGYGLIQPRDWYRQTAENARILAYLRYGSEGLQAYADTVPPASFFTDGDDDGFTGEPMDEPTPRQLGRVAYVVIVRTSMDDETQTTGLGEFDTLADAREFVGRVECDPGETVHIVGTDAGIDGPPRYLASGNLDDAGMFSLWRVPFAMVASGDGLTARRRVYRADGTYWEPQTIAGHARPKIRPSADALPPGAGPIDYEAEYGTARHLTQGEPNETQTWSEYMDIVDRWLASRENT